MGGRKAVRAILGSLFITASAYGGYKLYHYFQHPQTWYVPTNQVAVYSAYFAKDSTTTVLPPHEPPESALQDCDFYFFTNTMPNIEKEQTAWKIIIKEQADETTQRQYKMLPHTVQSLMGYKYTIYMDYDFKWKKSPKDLVNVMGKKDMLVFRHAFSRCVCEEAISQINRVNGGKASLVELFKRYSSFPDKLHTKIYPIAHSGILVRADATDNPSGHKKTLNRWKHFAEEWYSLFEVASRDELSLNVVATKHNIDIHLLERDIYQNEWLEFTNKDKIPSDRPHLWNKGNSGKQDQGHQCNLQACINTILDTYDSPPV